MCFCISSWLDGGIPPVCIMATGHIWYALTLSRTLRTYANSILSRIRIAKKGDIPYLGIGAFEASIYVEAFKANDQVFLWISDVQHLYLNICIHPAGEWLPYRDFLYENPWLAFLSWMVSGSPWERDHYHKFPRQLHLSSHYPTHLPMSQEPLKQERNMRKNKTKPIIGSPSNAIWRSFSAKNTGMSFCLWSSQFI